MMRTIVVDDEWLPAEMRREQENDPEIGVILQWKKNNQRPTWEEISSMSRNIKSYWAQWESLKIKDGLLMRSFELDSIGNERLQLVVPKSRVKAVLERLHDGTSGGHFGIKKNNGEGPLQILLGTLQGRC